MSKIPKKEELEFLTEYIANGGNAVAAGRETGFSKKTAIKKAGQLRGYIEKVMMGSNITPEYIIDRIHERVLKTKNDMAAIAGLKLMGENLGMWERKFKIEDTEGRPLKDMVAELKGVIDMIEKEGVFVEAGKIKGINKAIKAGEEEILGAK